MRTTSSQSAWPPFLLLLAGAFGCATVATPKPPGVMVSLRISRLTQPFNDDYRFVLYDSGLLLVQRTSKEHFAEYFSAELTPQEMALFMERLRISDFLKLATTQASASSKELPLYEIAAFDPQAGRLRKMTISGLDDADADPPPPPAFVQLYTALESYSHPRERPWFPDAVYLTTKRSTERTLCVWPSDWEDFASLGSLPLAYNPDPRADLGIIRAKGERLTDIQGLIRKCRHLVNLHGEAVVMRVAVTLPHEARLLAEAGVSAPPEQTAISDRPVNGEPPSVGTERAVMKRPLGALAGTWDGTFTLRGTVNGSYSGKISVAVHGDSIQVAHLCPENGERLTATGSGDSAAWQGNLACSPIAIMGCSSVVLTYNLATATLNGGTLTLVAAGTAVPTASCGSSSGDITVTFVARK